MPFTIDDLNYDKDSKERMPWEHYLELYAKADPEGDHIQTFHSI